MISQNSRLSGKNRRLDHLSSSTLEMFLQISTQEAEPSRHSPEPKLNLSLLIARWLLKQKEMFHMRTDIF